MKVPKSQEIEPLKSNRQKHSLVTDVVKEATQQSHRDRNNNMVVNVN